MVELLVVIAIIALLMSILMPALARVRKQAKNVICLTNLRQWGSVFAMYAGDHDGYFMQGWWSDAETLEGDMWMDATRPYYKDGDFRCCPRATKTGTEVADYQWGGCGTFTAWGVFDGSWHPPATPGDYGSYGMNGFLCNPPEYVTVIEDSPTSTFWRRADVKGAGGIPLFFDCQWVDARPREFDTPPDYNGQQWGIDHYNQMNRICFNRHEGAIGIVFLDCSAKNIGLKSLWKQKWHRLYKLNAEPPVWPDWIEGFPD